MEELTPNEILSLEDIQLSEGTELTIEEVFQNWNKQSITIDKDNVLINGIEAYLISIIKNEKKVKVKRAGKLQKINIGLASAA